MMGRAVLVLCLLVGIANACPIRTHTPEERKEIEALLARMTTEHERPHYLQTQPAVAAQLGTNVSDGVDWHGAAVAFALMGLCGFAFAITRGNAVRRTFATSQWMEDADVDVMLNVAKTQATRMAMFVGVCATALALFSSLPIELEARVILSVSPAMLMTIGVIALVRLQRLAAIDPDGVRVTAHGHYLFVARDKQLVGWVGASPELLARTSALPTAKLHR